MMGEALARQRGVADAPPVDPGRRLQSLYVPVSDGVRLGVEVWLPVDLVATAGVAGTILRATRYHRAGAPAGAGPEADPNFAEGRLWNDAGFALVIVDARGSGASFGSRAAELSEREIADYGEIIDWIAAQPWSNGRVGAYGYSYDGDAAELMARLGNPHLVAVAPLFSDFDPYRQLVYPGGCYAERAFGRWLAATRVLDGVAGAVADLAAETGLPEGAVSGLFPPVKPVDGPGGPALLVQAVRAHQGNADLAALIARAEFRDSREGGLDWDTPAVPRWQRQIESSDVPMFIRAGWLDAGTAAGALTRFATFANSQQVEIGPWSHGGDDIVDPLLPASTASTAASADGGLLSRASQDSRLVEFFARHVQHSEPPGQQAILRFSTLGTGRWTATSSWPPGGLTTTRWYLAAPGRLARTPGMPQTVQYQVDAAATTGETNRWAGNVAGQRADYRGRHAAGASLLTLATGPLPADVHILGFPVVRLRLATSGADGAVYVYLDAIGPGGDVAYVTEGALRFVHRKTAGPAAPAGLGVPRTFAGTDSQPIRPGEPMDLVIELLPVSSLIRGGHRIRVAVAGHDAACFRRYGPDSETMTVDLGKASWLDLPVLPSGDGADQC